MRWLLRLVLLRVLGSRVMLALAVLAWFRSALKSGAAARRRRLAAAAPRPSAEAVDPWDWPASH
jgi:hypothetical protein